MNRLTDWFRDNAAKFAGEVSFNTPLSLHTYYKIGGRAAALVLPKSCDDLTLLSNAITETGAQFFILGAGSNILVSDAGFSGLVIKISKLNLEINSPGPTSLCTGASVAISQLLRRAVTAGWGGLEFLAGIPGTVGGVVSMNAGTHLGEAKDKLLTVEAFLLKQAKQVSFQADSLRFEYRKNLFLPDDAIIFRASWRITAEDPAQLKKNIDDLLERRKATQPIDYPSCGSVFKNPSKDLHAWQVIDRLGLRGHRLGWAQFSEKHSNFIINLGSARSSDVYALIQLAKNRAQNELGISLEEEVRYVGVFGQPTTRTS